MSMDEIHRMLSERVAVNRDEILKKEEAWPDDMKATIRQAMTDMHEILNPDGDDPRPIAERLVDVRARLTVIVAALAGMSITEMIEAELEMAKLAELADALSELLGNDNPDLTNGN